MARQSAEYIKLKARYERKGCTKEQLRKFVVLGVLKECEYTEITGEKY